MNTKMEFRETLLAAQRNQQQQSSSQYYKARFDPPKKEQKSRDRLSANIQKFLQKKDEEEKQKKIEAQKKKADLLAMRDPKALRKIQKTLKVIKSANKSVLADAIDRDNTAVTRDGPDQPDQDDYGYESQEAAALYAKMMQKYSKIPDEPKFPTSQSSSKKDLNGTRERVKNALQHEDDPVPHKRKRRRENGERELSPLPAPEPEKRKDEKPKFRKPMPPPMDFNQLLKLAEQKKCEPLEAATPKVEKESEPERLMTKRQKKEYEEEMARRQRRQERIDAAKNGPKKIQRDDREIRSERERPEQSFGRIPKLSDKVNGSYKNDSPKAYDKERDRNERDRIPKVQKEKPRSNVEREKADREKERLARERSEKERMDKERLDRLKAERARIDREMEMLSKKPKLEPKSAERRPVDKSIDRSKLNTREPEAKKNIDLKSQNTYRIDKNLNDRKPGIPSKDNGKLVYGIQGKHVPKGLPQRDIAKDRIVQVKKPAGDGSPKHNGHKVVNSKKLPDKGLPSKRPDDRRPAQAGPSKSQISNSFDFDRHVSSLKNGQLPPQKRKPQMQMKAKRRLDSESEYDSEMDDFIDDGDENMDYSSHIKEIFGYDKSKYRDIDDHDDPNMESSFVQVQREEYISKKQGILEDLEDMRMEQMEKSKKAKKRRRISDD